MDQNDHLQVCPTQVMHPTAYGPYIVFQKLHFSKSHFSGTPQDQRTNGPVNAHLSLLHIPINMFEYYGIQPQCRGR